MKNERFYNSRIFNCFKRSICFFSCFILCICLIPSNLAFADNLPDFLTPEMGISCMFRDGTGNSSYFYCSTYSNNISLLANGYQYIVSNENTFDYYDKWGSSSSPNLSDMSHRTGSDGTLDTNTGLYYIRSTAMRNIVQYYFNVFSTLDEALTVASNYFNSTSSYPLLYDYDIPNGNVAYIQAANAGDTIYVSATFPQQSTLFSDSWSPMTMKYNWAPVTSGGVQTIHTSFPYNGQLDLPLVKSGDTNLLGQSKTGTCTFTQVASNSLEIYNPSYRQINASNQDQYLLNPSIHVHCDTGFISLSVYPLKESLTPGGITATADPANVMILQHTEDSTPEDPQSEWVGADTTSSTNPPAPGGDNELPETFTIGDYINKLHDTLSNFAKSVISLLEQPIEHISDLIQAGSGFMGALRGMYAWFPVDIQSLVISALTVVIGIGVFKVFL